MRNAHGSVTFKSLRVLTACIIATLTRCPAHGQIEPGRFLYTADNSIVLQRAARVADDTTELSWSPDGSRLITFNTHVRPIDAGETEANSEFTVVRWVRASHAASTLYSARITGNTDLVNPCTWLPTTDTAIADMVWLESLPPTLVNGVSQKQTKEHHVLLWIDVRHGTAKPIEISSQTLLLISPSRPLAVLTEIPRYASSDKPVLTTIRPDGTLGKSFEFAANQVVSRANWSEDGRRLNFTLRNLNTAHNFISSTSLYYDPVSGEVRPPSSEPSKPHSAPKAPTLQVSQPVRQMTEVETSARVRPLWVTTTVTSEHPRLLASADADLGVLSPDGSAIAYRSSGSAWVSELKSIPLAQFKQMLIQAQRAAAMQNGKEVALAILMYTQDNNETIPGPNQNVDLGQYMNDPTALSEFNQVYPGGPLADVASPADTILGTINGPGGVVDIYIDRHVKWRNQ